MAEKKDVLRKRLDSNYSFTPILQARYQSRKDKENRLDNEIAVVSSCDAISFSAIGRSGIFAPRNEKPRGLDFSEVSPLPRRPSPRNNIT